MAVAAERPRVLVSGQRADLLELIERMLGEQHECHRARGPAEARAKLTEGEFELAFCEIGPADEADLALVEELARDHPDVAIVVIADDDRGPAGLAYELGVHAYISEPFAPAQLLIAAANALRQRHLELAQRARSQSLMERLQSLVEMAPVPVYIKDREHRYLLANRATHEAAGVEPSQLIGRSDETIMSPMAARRVAAADRRVLDAGESYEEEETVNVGGAERTFLTVKFPYVDEAGEVVGIAGLSADITAKRRAEEEQMERAAAQARAIAKLRESRQETVERLAKAIEMGDAETGEHIKRVATIAAFLAHRLRFSQERVLLLRAAAPMHDVGNAAIPDAILRKRGPLSAEEREVMEQHTLVGHRILAGSESELLRMGASIALTHHERWDGEGYPQGLGGEEIPLEGRIVAVADVFDALLCDRSYREAMSLEEAVRVMREGRASHFEPRVVDILLANLEKVLMLRG